MALQAKVIKSKIKAVGNVKKITKAMEKVAAVKMRRAVSRTLGAREYAFHTYELLSSLLSHRNLKHPCFEKGKGKKVLLVAISSNRGLCGNLNTQIGRSTIEYIKEHPDTEFEMIAVGKKMERLAKRLNIKLIASFTTVPDQVSARDVLALTKLIRDEFSGGKYRKITVVYNHFASMLNFTPVVRQILPLDKKEIESTIEKLFKNWIQKEKHKFYEYTFEPGESAVLDFVLPKIIEIKLFKMLLESRACEHSARMMAMKNASENAQNLIEDLVVSFNQARQDGITREISEIAAGAAALGH